MAEPDEAVENEGRRRRPEPTPRPLPPRRRPTVDDGSAWWWRSCPGSRRSATSSCGRGCSRQGPATRTYVFTLILSIFLVGIAIGAAVYARRLRRSGRRRSAPLGSLQLLDRGARACRLAILSGQSPACRSSSARSLVVLPATLAIGLTLPLASSLVGGAEDIGARRRAAPRGEHARARSAGRSSSRSSSSRRSVRPVGRRPRARQRRASGCPAGSRRGAVALLPAGDRLARRRPALVVVAIVADTPRRGSWPTRVSTQFELRPTRSSNRPRTRSPRSRPAARPGHRHLLVGGTGMTRLTVDAKLMTYLPLMTRPDATRLPRHLLRDGLVLPLRPDRRARRRRRRARSVGPGHARAASTPDADGVLADPSGAWSSPTAGTTSS